MKIKQITALIIAILLSITVGNTALAIKLNCSTCGCWQEATFLGYVYWDNRFHCEQILCHVCNNVTEWWQTRHEASIAATCTERAYCNICKSYFGNAAGHSWGAWTSDGDGTHTRTCQREGCDETETKDCSGGTATCASKAICEVCNSQYGALDRNAHNWGAWISNGNGTHTRTCKNDSSHAETQDCSGGTATCVSPAYCDVCNSPYGNTDPNAHDVEHHKAKAATCLEKGWDAYETCKRDGCNYTTYKEIPALEHEIVKHDAKAPTCTEIGWDAYETCQREGCDYTTKVELPALNHDLLHHNAKAPTCTEIGWSEYDTCSRCGYTTYQEIPALGHDDTEQVVKPTCEKGGYTLHTCKNCNNSYKDHQTEKLLHWYGEWTNNGDGTNSATCKRKDCKHVGKTECAIVEFKQDEAMLTLCPVCGNVSDGTLLTLVEEVTAEGEHLPRGELALRMGKIANGNTLLSVCFEYSGKLTQPKGEVKITLPAELLNGVTLALLNADDTEIDLPCIVEGENAAFTLDFTDAELPTALIRLIPTAE